MLNTLYVKAISIEEGMVDSRFELTEVVKIVYAASTRAHSMPMFSEFIENITAKCPLEFMDHQKKMSSYNARDAAEQLGDMNLAVLVNLHRQLIKQLNEYQRCLCSWELLIEETVFLENVLAAYDSKPRTIEGLTERKYLGGVIVKLQWTWYTRLGPLCSRLASVVCVVMGVLVVLGEVSLFIDYSLSPFPLLVKEDHGETLTQLYSMVPLVYIMLATKFGLFRLKLSGWYGLYPHNQTDPGNLIWSAYFVARLTAPLAYNFILLIDLKGTQFSKFMDIIEIIPVMGKGFAIFFPLSLVLFCAMNLFNVYGRFMRFLGLGSFSFADTLNYEKIAEGKALVQKTRGRTITRQDRPEIAAWPQEKANQRPLFRPFRV